MVIIYGTETVVEFEQFAADRLPALVRFTTAICADAGLAEDLVQDVLIRIHARWAKVGALDLPEAYVRRALVNEYLSWRRKWSRLIPRADVTPLQQPVDPAEQVAQRSELAQRLATLPARQRAVLVLRYYEDLSDNDIASVLGCRPATVRSYAARALAALRIAGVEAEDQHVR
jgi:RNA polymerase sigma-70 factor (sigma-E family)